MYILTYKNYSAHKNTRRNLPRLLPTYSSVHGALHVYIVLNKHIDSKIKPKCTAAIPQMLRRHTHRQSNEQGLYTCTPTASIFVCFSLKVHHPPLESSESHAGGAALKVCQRGEAPGPGLEAPIATQSPRHRTSPVQSNSKAEKRSVQASTGNTLSINMPL